MKRSSFTSLPPELTRIVAGAEVGTSYLAECVRSWRRAGFDVVSLNAQEIEAVARQGYEAECRPISGDRPTIDDFLAAIRASRASVAGIINADVLLVADPALLRIDGGGEDGMTLIERINIDPDSLRPNGQSCSGFDALVFATAPLSRIDQGEGFLFGHPWWDYWFPLAYAMAGGRLRTANTPVLFHLQHKQKWSREHFIANGRRTVSWLLRSQDKLPDDIVAEIRTFSNPGDLSEADLVIFGTWCFAKLRTMAKPIDVARPTSGSGSLGEFVALLGDPQHRALIGELNGAEARVLAADELIRAIDQISPVGEQRIPRCNEDARRIVDRAAWILGSRKATLSHFWALNIRSFKRFRRGQAVTSAPLRSVVRALGEAFFAIAGRVRRMTSGLKSDMSESTRASSTTPGDPAFFGRDRRRRLAARSTVL